MPGYSCHKESGDEMHSVDFTERNFLAFEALWSKTWTWKTAIFYVDGQPMIAMRAWEAARNAYWKLNPEDRVASVNPAIVEGAVQARRAIRNG